MEYFGLWLLVWLFVGFVVAMKLIYIDKQFSKENLRKDMGDLEIIYNFDDNRDVKRIQKKIFAIIVLLGFISFIIDTVETFAPRKK